MAYVCNTSIHRFKSGLRLLGIPENVSFTVIRKYLQQLIINADKQSVQETENKLKMTCPLFFTYCLSSREKL